MADPNHCILDDPEGCSTPPGFSLSSPDLVVCADSPDIPRNSIEILCRNQNYVALSLENGINGSDVKHSTMICNGMSPESSLELLPQPVMEKEEPKIPLPCITVNAGSTKGAVVLDGVQFLEDDGFAGGDTTRTNAIIGDGKRESLSLYQTARFGNFSYHFPLLEKGNYVVSLHFAEILFTDGPPGIRVFDVLIQEKKVVSSLDIFGQVGANKPLVVSDIKTSVDGEKGLSIRFDGVIGSAIVSGISITKDASADDGGLQLLKATQMSQVADDGLPQVKWHGNDDSAVEGDYQKLLRDYECQKSELLEMRKALEELKRENQLKNRECQDAWTSLQELQNELMRKSMHVGSLAFAIEGQVKEKTRWFSVLRDLTRKLKIMKMEHIKISEEAFAFKTCLADIREMTSTIQSTCMVKQQVDLHKELKIKFIEGTKERKDLYNKVLELKGNIRVFCRCRPLNAEEIAAGASMAIDFESAKDGELTVISNGLPRKTFKFDAVFSPQIGQADVFEDTAPFATSVLDGYNVCIFAYGQTGTGKTFTMEGTEEARGVNFRTLEEIFWIIKERQEVFKYDISVSVLEVYNEQIRDLLASASQPGVVANRLEIRQMGEGLYHVPGLVEAHVNNMSEVWEVLQTGSNARAVGSTNANEHSSRSHCIHCVMVKGKNLLNGDCTRSKLWLVDLAGSERISKTESQGERLKETQNINRSLSALGDVISALATKSSHVPFRNSKLTHLLQDSLGGDSKTLMFLQISPNEKDLGETLCSLNFASRVRGIELGPAKKQLDTVALLKNKHMQELKSKDLQIKKMEETIQALDSKIKEKDLKNKNLQGKVKELESQLLIERKLARQHVDTKIVEQQQLKQHQDEQNMTPLRPLNNRNLDEPMGSAVGKDQLNPLAENNKYKPVMTVHFQDGNMKCIDPTEKENKPEMAEQVQPIKKSGRASICTASRRIPIAPSAPRRNSLIPLPTLPSLTELPPTLFPLCQFGMKEETETNCLPLVQCSSPPKDIRSGTKKVSSMLRQSLQKKNPLHQHQRKVGINVGMEKVRVSIGSRGRKLSNCRRAGMKETQHKQILREKERGWKRTAT